MMTFLYIFIGTLIGIFSGFLGLGGGLVAIPILVYSFGLTQHQAQGTSLAMMVPPITLLAALRYYYSGDVKVGMAIFLACGFMVGGLIGADLVQYVPNIIAKKIFGVVLLLTALKMIFIK